MSDTEDRNPLVERLGAERLSAPGVLNRNALESRYDNLTRGATPNGLVEKLHRRSAFSSNTGGSFVWSQARGSQSLGSEPMPIVSATPAHAPIATTASPKSILQRKEIGPSPVQTHARPAQDVRAFARFDDTLSVLEKAPGLTLSHASLTPSPRSARERVGVRGNEQSSPVSASASPISSATPAPAMIMRKAADPSAPQAALSSPPTPGPTPASSPTAQQPDSPIAAASSAAIRRPTMPTVLARKAASDAPSFLARSVSAPLVPAYRSAPSIAARAPSSSTGAASMLMRRLEDPRPTNAPHFGAPPVTPQRPSNQVAPEETKAAPSAPDDAAVESYSHHADNDALADQVSQRILRRLEIERERRGERSWR